MIGLSELETLRKCTQDLSYAQLTQLYQHYKVLQQTKPELKKIVALLAILIRERQETAEHR